MACVGEQVYGDLHPTKKKKLSDADHSSPGMEIDDGKPSLTAYPCADDEYDAVDLSDADDSVRNCPSDFDSDQSEDSEARQEYFKKCNESGGFDVDEVKGYSGMIFPINRKKYPETFEDAKQLSEMAIGVFNQDNDSNYKFTEVVKLNFQFSGWFEYYITFEALNESKAADVETFQALAFKSVPDETCPQGLHVQFCRVKAKGTTN